MAPQQKQSTNAPVPAPLTEQSEIAVASSKFIERVKKQFTSELGQDIQFSKLESTLAQHIFIKTDIALAALEKKRLSDSRKRDNPPIVWGNVNMLKLAIDAVHRVVCKLDALIPNHIHVVPYLNGRTGKYDVDLRIGYAGVDFVHRQNAVTPPIDVVYELVHETDTFEPHMKGMGNEVESYTFAIKNPFNRGKVIGGFGYIAYDDQRKNKLLIITQRDFGRSRDAAGGNDFWAKHDNEMMYKTIVHRVASKIPLDPAKVNGFSLQQMMIESAMDSSEFAIDAEIAELGNGEILALGGSTVVSTPAMPQHVAEPVPVEQVTAHEADPATSHSAPATQEDPGY